jgi:hypothetical protein
MKAERRYTPDEAVNGYLVGLDLGAGWPKKVKVEADALNLVGARVRTPRYGAGTVDRWFFAPCLLKWMYLVKLDRGDSLSYTPEEARRDLTVIVPAPPRTVAVQMDLFGEGEVARG